MDDMRPMVKGRLARSCVFERCVVARCGAADDRRDRDRLVQVEQHGVDDRGELIPSHAVLRVGVPGIHEQAKPATQCKA